MTADEYAAEFGRPAGADLPVAATADELEVILAEIVLAGGAVQVMIGAEAARRMGARLRAGRKAVADRERLERVVDVLLDRRGR
jgi:hypothetical protein